MFIVFLKVMKGAFISHFLMTDEEIKETQVLLWDSRQHFFGNVLHLSLPRSRQKGDPQADSGEFEAALTRVYDLIRSQTWLDQYYKGYLLFLARQMVKAETIEIAFMHAWTLFEHVFAIEHSHLTEKQIWNTPTKAKIAYVLRQYGFTGKLRENAGQIRIRDRLFKGVRNPIAHFGLLPATRTSTKDAVTFVRLAEALVAKILGLTPKDIFGTQKNLKAILRKR